MRHVSSIWRLVIWTLVFTVLVPAGRAGSQPQSPTPAALTRSEIDDAIAQVRADPVIEVGTKATALELLGEAAAQIDLAQQSATRADQFAREQREAPRQTESIRAELARQTDETARVDAAASLQVADAALAKATVDVNAARETASELDDDKTNYAVRRVELPGLLATGMQSLERVRIERVAESDAGTVGEARRLLSRAREHALTAEIAALQRELDSVDARRDLIVARSDQLVRRSARLEQLTESWREVVATRRREAADAAVQEAEAARQRVATIDPAVRELAEENAALAEMRAGSGSVAKRIDQVTREIQRTRSRLGQINDQFAIVRRRVSLVGYTEAIGPLMRKHRAELPDLAQYRRRMRSHQEEIAKAQLILFELADKRAAIADPDARIAQVLAVADPPLDSEQRDKARQEGRALLRVQREYLDGLLRDYDRYFGALAALDAAERELLAVADVYHDFILEHVLWIRSAEPLGPTAALPASRALLWIGDPRNWARVLRRLGTSLVAYPIVALAWGAVVGTLFAYQPRLRRRLHQAGARRMTSAAVFFRETAQRGGITLLITAPWVVAVYFAAWLLDPGAGEPEPFARALSRGLLAIAPVYLGAELLRQLLHPSGIVARDLGAGSARTQPLRANLAWAMVWGLPFLLLANALAHAPDRAWGDSLGRVAFCAAISVLGVSLLRLLRAEGPLSASLLLEQMAELKRRPARLVRWSMFLGTCALIATALAGYYFTAFSLATQFYATLLAIVGIVLLYALLARALQLSQLAFAIAQRRALAVPTAATETAAAVDETAALPDLPVLSAQAHQLLRLIAGAALFGVLWLVWSDELPALQALDSVALWSVEGSDAEPIAITLGDLLSGSLIIVVAVIAGRNLPGFLQVVVLQRLPIDAGTRYAITTVAQYLIALASTVLAFNTVGMKWHHVQWLAAAMTVGLGFGLQEIVANFVSGLILLFERPIRVGDTVTLGEVSGVVTQIRIRATTITDWDRKELIVPNKEFITGQLVNWTRSDDILRLVVNVGIAYGSDIDLAEKLLLEAAAECRMVRNDPPPSVLFNAFGESALDFSLRVFISHINDMWQTRHWLHRTVDRKFREAGITMAFPQRDLHLASVREPIPVRVLDSADR